jgi:hypothetical protein
MTPMPSHWWPKRATNAPRGPVNTYGPVDVAQTLDGYLASDEGRAVKAFDKALAFDRSHVYRAFDQGKKSAVEDSYADKAADDLDLEKGALQLGISIGSDILRDPSDALYRLSSTQPADHADGLGGVGLDILGDVLDSLGSGMISAAVDATVARNVCALYRDLLTKLPAIIHTEVSFDSGSCWLIAIKDWRLAVVLPGNRDKVQKMPLAAKMSPAGALNWAGQLRGRPDVRLTKMQDTMLAALVDSGRDDTDASPVAVVVSPPWPPTKIKVHKEREFRRWWYRVTPDRALVTWEPPAYNGGLGATSIRVLTYPPPGAPTDSEPDTAAVSVPQALANDRKSSGYENENSVRITGLAPTTAYRLAVVAANALGYSDRTEATLIVKRTLSCPVFTARTHASLMCYRCLKVAAITRRMIRGGATAPYAMECR